MVAAHGMPVCCTGVSAADVAPTGLLLCWQYKLCSTISNAQGGNEGVKCEVMAAKETVPSGEQCAADGSKNAVTHTGDLASHWTYNQGNR